MQNSLIAHSSSLETALSHSPRPKCSNLKYEILPTRESTFSGFTSYCLSIVRSTQKNEQLVTVDALLGSPTLFHKQNVTVRGIIAQPEIHLDDTELFFNFVFLLKDGNKSIIVFGRHDRTQGGSSITMGNTVEVTGTFWKDRIAHEYHFKNNLEAITIRPYPSLTPDRT